MSGQGNPGFKGDQGPMGLPVSHVIKSLACFNINWKKHVQNITYWKLSDSPPKHTQNIKILLKKQHILKAWCALSHV